MIPATLRFCATVAGLVAILALPAAAQARTLDTAIDRNLGAVTDFVQRGGATSTVPTPVNPGVVDDLWLAEHRPMPNQATSDAMHSELRALRTKAGVLPKPSAIAGAVTLGPVAFQIGWMIGTGVRQKFLGLEGASSTTATTTGLWGTPTATKLYPVDKGKCMLNTAVQTCDGSPSQYGPWPADGWIAEVTAPYAGGTSSPYKMFSSCSNSSNAVRPPAAFAPQGFGMYSMNVADSVNCTGGGTGQSQMAYKPMRVKSPIVAGDGQVAHVTTANTATPDVSRELAQQRVQAELQDNAADYPTLLPWLDSQLGGPSSDPTLGTLVIPQVQTDEQYGAYAARLTDLGLVPARQTRTTPDPDHGPDAVISTAPASGTRVASGSTVTVETNSATAPAPTGSGSPPAVHAINLGPLNVAAACQNFPFGVPCWIADTLSTWVVTGVTAPVWHVPFPTTDGFDLDLEVIEPIAPLLRGLLLILSTLGLALKFYSLATGSSNGGDD